ncbi:MAG: helix-turn-helix transcriptional regulator [Arenicella sp.]
MSPKDVAVIAALVSACGSRNFGHKLDCFGRLYGSFDMSSIFVFFQDRDAIVLHDGYSDSIDRNTLKMYLKGGYLLDPFYVACITNFSDGLWRMQDLVPDNFHSSGFMLSKEIHPCISDTAGTLVEEIGYIVNLGNSAYATYSLMRNSSGKRFNKDEFSKLEAIQPIVASCIKQHWKCTATDHLTPAKLSPEWVFHSAFGDKLTETQQKVVKLILRGHSNASVAINLSITEGTTKNHRYNIYKRLNITSQAELFKIFIDHLLH